MRGVSAELSHVQERYLRAVYEISKTKPRVFQADVARVLGRSKASVCRAVVLLRRKGLLEPDRRDLVLTAEALALEQRLHRARERLRAVLEQFPGDAAGMEELAFLLGGEEQA